MHFGGGSEDCVCHSFATVWQFWDECVVLLGYSEVEMRVGARRLLGRGVSGLNSYGSTTAAAAAHLAPRGVIGAVDDVL